MADPPITITILGEDRQVVAGEIYIAAPKIEPARNTNCLLWQKRCQVSDTSGARVVLFDDPDWCGPVTIQPLVPPLQAGPNQDQTAQPRRPESNPCSDRPPPPPDRGP